MTALATVNVTSRSPATLLFGGTGNTAHPVQVINKSPNITIWLSNISNVMPGTGIALEPGASSTFDGSVSIYAIANSMSASVAIVPGGISYSPGLPVLSSVTASASSGTLPIFTFPATGRIWTAELSYALVSDASYTTAISTTAAYIKDATTGFVLVVAQAVVSGPSDAAEANVVMTFPGGLAINAGDLIELVMDAPITNVFQLASVIIHYSIP